MTKQKALPHMAPESRPAIADGSKKRRRNAVQIVKQAPATKRGAETRERLKQAAVVVLERSGYRALRLQDIAEEAGVNMSLLYHYFSGKADLTREILSELLDSMSKPVDLPSDPFESILAANRIVVETYRSAPGLMRCLLHLDEEEIDFAALYRDVSLQWSKRVAVKITKLIPGNRLTEGQRLMVAYALGGMVDAFLFELYVDRNPNLQKEFAEPDDAARFLAIMWFRALYAKNPVPANLGSFTGFETLLG
jgi:AcrR family transcriptional regulator